MAPSKSKRSAGTPITDPRFAHIQSDPRYRLPSKKNQRVALDSRFKRLLQDDEFRSKASVDRYGRKVNKKERGKELERLYRVEDEEEEKPTPKKSKQPELASASEDEESGEDDKVVRRELRRAEGYDPAREGGFSSSESESESEEDEEELDIEEVDEQELENVGEEVEEGEVTRRLAVVNLDWDNIRAVDLLAVARSFVPAGGTVEKVAVYPSEFGRERMEQEEQEGPPREIFRQGKPASSVRPSSSKAKPPKRKAHNPEFSDSESESEASDSKEEDERIKNQLLEEENPEDFNPAALREYQLSRLRYFYAIITLSSTGSAHSLYTSMDGREYLSSANFFDLRFVPDDTEFDENPRDEAIEVPHGYRPNEFVTDALTRSKVRLTWDEDDRERKEVQRRAFARGEEEDADLAAYIGSSSSESEKEDDDQEGGVSVLRETDGKKDQKAAKLRAALGLTGAMPLSKKDGQSGGEVTMTWSTGQPTAAGTEASKNESTRDAYVRKEKERKAKRKERAKARRVAETGEAPDSDSEGGVPVNASTADVADDMDEGDPFDDPFFTQDPESAKQEAKKAAKVQKARKRAEQAKAEESAKAERAQLELLLDDEVERGKHFDMAAIEKAQKQAKRKGKKKKSAALDIEAAADGFKIDVKDPRFQKLYTNHEFAIDPSNPRYKATDGMKALLEEGRRKRKNRGLERDVEEDASGKRKKRKDEKADELATLVAKVKAKEKRR